MSMKKIIIPALLIVLWSCNNNNTSNNDNDSANVSTDTTIPPNGVTEGSAISADTAAYRAKDTTKER